MSDPIRNEIELDLAGETRTMHASFAAIRGIEAALGKSITAIINNVAVNGDLSVTDAATIVYHGLRGFDDKRLSLDQVGDAIMVAGVIKVSVHVVEFLTMALNGVSVGKSTEPTPAQ